MLYVQMIFCYVPLFQAVGLFMMTFDQRPRLLDNSSSATQGNRAVQSLPLPDEMTYS